MPPLYTLKEAQHKIEQYCAYQERCHEEVVTKLRGMHLESQEIDQLIVHLIEQNFLNEARFACSFARGKHRIKHWGKIRITNELKMRNINNTLIALALKEISAEEYSETFNALAERNWQSITEKNALKKRKKFCDYMLRRGFESNLIYDKVKELEYGNADEAVFL
ncbi:regulatory protein [Flavobacterium succinicans]|uniref:Regulatory protein RecX n=1 Tax=Flavobacterium succinicans TaxID=29536 RepID=A0A1I4V8U2_9FLAO|nr:regulatory protein RecX [Flavobacterium succinicans]SFM97594.1 regulatory protein [Flavobacterium succinicans]